MSREKIRKPPVVLQSYKEK